jgi:hypothetical protein
MTKKKSKYVIGFTGHFYVEANTPAEADRMAKDWSLSSPPPNGYVRIDYVDWVI